MTRMTRRSATTASRQRYRANTGVAAAEAVKPRSFSGSTLLFVGKLSSAVLPSGSRERFIVFAIGFLVLLGPMLILVLTLAALVLLGDLALGRISLFDFLELYIIDLTLFVGLAYGIYRLTFWVVETRLPESLETLEELDTEGSRDDESQRPDDR